MRAAVLAMLLLAVCAGPAQAQQTQRYDRELHGLKGADDRLAVEAGQYPWSAMGRLNNGLGGHCSAVLVGPRLLATAAHCLFNRKTRAVIPAGSLTFVAGYDRGQYLKASKVQRLHPSPGWSYTGPSPRDQDWALLELSEPLGEDVGWLGLGDDPAPGQPVTAAGYGKDKAHVPTAHVGCRVLRRQGALLVNDCDAVQGDSGGPLLAWRDGRFVLAGLNVAVMVSNGDLGIALAVGAFKVEAMRLGAAAEGRPGRLSRPLDAAVRARAAGL